MVCLSQHRWAVRLSTRPLTFTTTFRTQCVTIGAKKIIGVFRVPILIVTLTPSFRYERRRIWTPSTGLHRGWNPLSSITSYTTRRASSSTHPGCVFCGAMRGGVGRRMGCVPFLNFLHSAHRQEKPLRGHYAVPHDKTPRTRGTFAVGHTPRPHRNWSLWCHSFSTLIYTPTSTFEFSSQRVWYIPWCSRRQQSGHHRPSGVGVSIHWSAKMSGDFF